MNQLDKSRKRLMEIVASTTNNHKFIRNTYKETFSSHLSFLWLSPISVSPHHFKYPHHHIFEHKNHFLLLLSRRLNVCGAFQAESRRNDRKKKKTNKRKLKINHWKTCILWSRTFWRVNRDSETGGFSAHCETGDEKFETSQKCYQTQCFL